jgi:hypothetical protein
MILLKVDAAGDTVWTRVRGGAEIDWGMSVCVTTEGNYAVGGSSLSGWANLKIWLMEFAPDGMLLWENWYGDAGPVNPDWGVSVAATDDSGIALTGYRAIEGLEVGDVGILRTDGDGGQVFYRRGQDPFYQYGNSICLTDDGGYLVCGSTKDAVTLKNDLYLIKRVPGSGWTVKQSYGGDDSDWGWSIDRISSGNYVAAGYTESYGAGKFDGWLLRLRDAATAVEEGASAPRTLFLSPPRPNPSRGSMAFSLSLPRSGAVDVRVVNVAGKLVRSIHRGEIGPGSHDFEWDARNEEGRAVASGVYFIIADGAATAMRRAVVVR